MDPSLFRVPIEQTKIVSRENSNRAPPFVKALGRDRRFEWGDDFAGDGWMDAKGQIFWVVVGVDPNVTA